MASRRTQGTATTTPTPTERVRALLLADRTAIPLKSANFQQLVRLPGSASTAQRIVVGSSASHVNVDSMELDPERGLIVAVLRGAVQVYDTAGCDMEVHMEAVS